MQVECYRKIHMLFQPLGTLRISIVDVVSRWYAWVKGHIFA